MRFLHVIALILGFTTGLVRAETPKPIPPEHFDKILKLIKPQSGELRFQEIPWLMSTWDARKKAAEEGKPILIWSGSGGAPLGVC
jgi:hypothetical protein